MAELTLERVVVVRALKGLGDFLCAVPAFRALRAAVPGAHITLIGLPFSRALVSRYSAYIDQLLPFPGFPGIPEAPVDVALLPGFFAAAQAQSFGLALQMHGNGALTNPFTVMLGARTTGGYYAPGAYCPDSDTFLPLDESAHEVRRWLRLLDHFGIPGSGEDLEFPLLPSDWRDVQETPDAAALSGSRYIVVHPGATEEARRWSPDHFTTVADFFARDGYRVVLTGTAEEAGIAGEVAARMRYRALNLAGRTSLGAMAALLSQASLLVSNDTGVSHLAAALRVPSVVVFIASDPLRWAPLDRDLHRVVGRDGIQPDSIGPDAILREAYKQLEPRLQAKRARPGAHQEAARVVTARA